MRDRIQITQSKTESYLRQVAFDVTASQAKQLIDDLRIIQNDRYGVAENSGNFGQVPDFAIIVSAVTTDRKECEARQRRSFERGEMEGLS